MIPLHQITRPKIIIPEYGKLVLDTNQYSIASAKWFILYYI